jgi:hypothetical protein
MVKFERGLRERICSARIDSKATYCVRLATMDTGYREVTTYTSTRFDALAKRFNLAPDYLAFLLLEDFCDHPPDGLLLVSRDPSDALQDDEPPPLERGE